MPVSVSSKTARKRWGVLYYEDSPFLNLEVQFDEHLVEYVMAIEGASPAYVEALVEELNITANAMLYNLGRIAV